MDFVISEQLDVGWTKSNSGSVGAWSESTRLRATQCIGNVSGLVNHSKLDDGCPKNNRP